MGGGGNRSRQERFVPLTLSHHLLDFFPYFVVDDIRQFLAIKHLGFYARPLYKELIIELMG